MSGIFGLVKFVWSILCFAMCQLYPIYGGSIAVCSIKGNDGVTWFYVGTTEELDDKTGSLVLSGSGTISDGSYPFGAMFTNDEFWYNSTYVKPSDDSSGEWISELERIKRKGVAGGNDEQCSMCDVDADADADAAGGRDMEDLYNGAIKTWQRKRITLNDGTYTISTSHEASIQNDCDQVSEWHEVTVTSEGPFVRDLCFNSTHRWQHAYTYGYDCSFTIINETYPSNCVMVDAETRECTYCLYEEMLLEDDGCAQTEDCAAYDEETRECLECDKGYILVYHEFPQCWLAHRFACESISVADGEYYVENYYGCKQCDNREGYATVSTLWKIPHQNGESIHYCVHEIDNTTFAINNVGCEHYKTCDYYNAGDYDCEFNPYCERTYDWGCSQCQDGYWMISQDHPCRECPADCNDCQDYVGCINGGCEDGNGMMHVAMVNV